MNAKTTEDDRKIWIPSAILNCLHRAISSVLNFARHTLRGSCAFSSHKNHTPVEFSFRSFSKIKGNTQRLFLLFALSERKDSVQFQQLQNSYYSKSGKNSQNSKRLVYVL